MARRIVLASMRCGCCDDNSVVPINSVSLEWLFTNACILFWAEKLLVTKQDFSNLHLQPYFDDEVNQECAYIFFERMRDEGIIEVFDPNIFLNEVTLSSIENQVEKDIQCWGIEGDSPNKDGLFDHNTILLGNDSYCPPMVQGIYGSLTVARFINCTCVFDHRQRSYLENRFSTISDFKEYHSAGLEVFNDLYKVLLPRLNTELDYMLFCDPDQGRSCVRQEECRGNAKNNLKRMIEHILVTREKPEICKLTKKLDDLENEVGPNESCIRRALIRDINREQRNVRLAYPSVKHWSRITQTVSAPAILYGTQTGQPLIWMTAAAIAAFAEAIKVSVDVIQEKRRWLTLIAESL